MSVRCLGPDPDYLVLILLLDLIPPLVLILVLLLVIALLLALVPTLVRLVRLLLLPLLVVGGRSGEKRPAFWPAGPDSWTWRHWRRGASAGAGALGLPPAPCAISKFTTGCVDRNNVPRVVTPYAV